MYLSKLNLFHFYHHYLYLFVLMPNGEMEAARYRNVYKNSRLGEWELSFFLPSTPISLTSRNKMTSEMKEKKLLYFSPL
jgi:hypothetical protein